MSQQQQQDVNSDNNILLLIRNLLLEERQREMSGHGMGHGLGLGDGLGMNMMMSSSGHETHGNNNNNGNGNGNGNGNSSCNEIASSSSSPHSYSSALMSSLNMSELNENSNNLLQGGRQAGSSLMDHSIDHSTQDHHHNLLQMNPNLPQELTSHSSSTSSYLDALSSSPTLLSDLNMLSLSLSQLTNGLSGPGSLNSNSNPNQMSMSSRDVHHNQHISPNENPISCSLGVSSISSPISISSIDRINFSGLSSSHSQSSSLGLPTPSSASNLPQSNSLLLQQQQQHQLSSGSSHAPHSLSHSFSQSDIQSLDVSSLSSLSSGTAKNSASSSHVVSPSHNHSLSASSLNLLSSSLVPNSKVDHVNMMLMNNMSQSLVSSSSSPLSLPSLSSHQRPSGSASSIGLQAGLHQQRQQQIAHNQHQSHSQHQNSVSSSSQQQQLMGLESQIRLIADDIQSTIQVHMNGLQNRKEQLLKQLEHIKQIYTNVIINNVASNQQQSSLILSTTENTHSSTITCSLPQISFTRPDSALYKAVTNIGFLTTPAFAANCLSSGDGLEVAIEGQTACFSIVTKNCFNEELCLGGEKIDIEIVAKMNGSTRDDMSMSETMSVPHSLVDHNNGKYTCSYTAPRGGGSSGLRIVIRIVINGMPVKGSPFVAKVESQRTRHVWKKIATFGCEGNQPGQFCRPWGVAVAQNNNREYLIAVADRSNNRVQLLKLDLPSSSPLSNNVQGGNESSNMTTQSQANVSVLHVFGSGPGTRPGQFDRPAGIAFNISLGHVIVADKDNHRVQVFDLKGVYQFKFGEKGSRAGQFCYPWDLDSNVTSHQILVSDTRNRRVQLFTPYGQYLWHVGQPLDSPRGVAFLTIDKFVVSDFNKHRLLIVDRSIAAKSPSSSTNDDSNPPKYIGFGEGSAWGEFLRPQGVTVSGNSGSSGGSAIVFCSDSRNNRISMWCSNTQSFEYLSEDAVMVDRPAGVAVADSIIVVVDFGNNRLQILQR